MSGGGTPRQQMIGLMYLVLLAMLAMNASKDLLNAFVYLERGIDKTVKNFAIKNENYYFKIEAAAAKGISKDKAVKANAIKAKATELVDFLEKSKIELVSGGELTLGATPEDMTPFLDGNGIPLAKDNQDVGAGYFLVKDDGAIGEKLKTTVNEFRDLVVSTLDSDGIPENDYLKEKWQKILFTDDAPDPGDPEVIAGFASRLSEHIPMASVTANLTLWQSYVRNAEADVVGSLAGTLDGKGLVVNAVDCMAYFKNGYVLKGNTVSAYIFIAAYNKDISPVVYSGVPDMTKLGDNGAWLDKTSKAKPPIVGEAIKVNVSGGKGRFSKVTDETGEKVLEGVIGIPSTKGIDYFLYKSNYMVAEPSATVAAMAMNVFYVGVKNPVSVSAPGVATENIKISAPGLSFVKGKKSGEYNVTPTRATGRKGLDVVVTNSISNAKLGSSKFRVKRLPDPVAKVLGQKEGLISRGKLKVASRVDAVMENFDFELKVAVSSFTMTVNMGGDLVEMRTKGNKLDKKMQNMLKRVKKGSRVYFENIKVAMPGGKPRKVPSIVFKVK